MRLKKIISTLEQNFPLNIKEEWDNVGLLVGSNDAEVKKIQISLDLTDNVIEEAIKNNIDLIITHHPFIFKALKKINNESAEGKKIIKLIKNNINVYSLHTNLDSAKAGLNEYIAKLIGATQTKILSPIQNNLLKLRVYIPLDVFEEVKTALLKANKFETDKYKEVYYNYECYENFTVKEGANPFKNSENIKNKILEVITDSKNINNIVSELKKVHPYEEPAYDIIELKNLMSDSGIGRYFTLEKEIMFSEYIKLIKEKLNIKNVRAVFKEDKLIKKAAIVNGSGASYIGSAKSKGVDVFITGDLKYHEALDAYESGILLIDIGHYESEVIFFEIIKNILIDYKEIEKIIIFNEEPVFKYV